MILASVRLTVNINYHRKEFALGPPGSKDEVSFHDLMLHLLVRKKKVKGKNVVSPALVPLPIRR